MIIHEAASGDWNQYIPIISAFIGVFGSLLAALLGVTVGSRLTRNAAATAARNQLLMTERLSLLKTLSTLELNLRDFDQAAKAIPLLYEEGDEVLAAYAYYRTEGKDAPLGGAAFRRVVVEAMRAELTPKFSRENAYERLSKSYQAAHPDHPKAHLDAELKRLTTTN